MAGVPSGVRKTQVAPARAFSVIKAELHVWRYASGVVSRLLRMGTCLSDPTFCRRPWVDRLAARWPEPRNRSPSSAFLPRYNDLSYSLPMNAARQVSSLSRRGMFPPVSRPLKPGVCLSMAILYPQIPTVFLAVHLPVSRRDYALTLFRKNLRAGRPPLPRRRLSVPGGPRASGHTLPRSFWFKPVSTARLACSNFRAAAKGSHMLVVTAHPWRLTALVRADSDRILAVSRAGIPWRLHCPQSFTPGCCHPRMSG